MDKIASFNDTIEWYNKNAETYSSNIENLSSPDLINRFIKTLDNKGKILDAGCAGGRDSKLFKDAGLVPIGIDLSEKLLKIAKKNNPNIQFKHANFLDIPFEDETFNGVWANASLLHLEKIKDVEKALSEFYRVLKNNGIIHIFLKEQKGEDKTSIVSDKLSNHHDRFFRWFIKSEIKSLLENTGFNIENIQDKYKDPANRKDVTWIVVLARKK